MPSILVIDDDDSVLGSLRRTLGAEGYDVNVARSAEEALNLLASRRPDLVLSDVRLGGMDGIELLGLLRSRASDVDVVMMTAYGDLATVAAAMQAGASDFLVKPLELRQLRAVVGTVLDDRRKRRGASGEAPAAPPAGLIGRDTAMLEIFKLVAQVAVTRASVVIRGESGTGKELIARAIHDSSPWRDEPFVAINCTAVPANLLESELFGHVRGSFTGATADRRGRFSLAGRGTIFLDEIGDTAAEFQAKLLRVLQEREYFPVGAERPERSEARVIAATHRDLERLVERGLFREDLYYRLRVVEISLPPLRERRGDIPPLSEHLIAKAAASLGRATPAIAPDTMDTLLAHPWPGNVRELENCLTRAAVLATGGVVRPAHLSIRGGSAAPPAPQSLENAIRDHIVDTLELTSGGKSRAARILGISRPRLDRLIEKYGIDVTELRD